MVNGFVGVVFVDGICQFLPAKVSFSVSVNLKALGS